MKAVLVLLLALGCVANPLTFGQFMAGYNAGVAEPESCLENPELCGESLGELVALLGTLMKDYNLENYFQSPQEDVQNFITGLVAGLTLSNTTVSNCVSDLTQSNYQISAIVDAILTLINAGFQYGEVIEVACSGATVANLAFLTDCNFRALWNNIINFNFSGLATFYLAHSCDINTSLSGLIGCSSNYVYCGYSTGVIVREVFTWGI